jgi:hypothetical protein
MGVAPIAGENFSTGLIAAIRSFALQQFRAIG